MRQDLSSPNAQGGAPQTRTQRMRQQAAAETRRRAQARRQSNQRR